MSKGLKDVVLSPDRKDAIYRRRKDDGTDEWGVNPSKKGALAGAAAGTALGSAVPVIGTGIGAVVGGIAGWILGPGD